MARGNPVILGNGREFATQKEATAFFKDILNSKPERITTDHKNHSDVMALYKRHPEFENKSKSEENIQYFLVKNSGEFNTICFHAVHKDGSQTDWSYNSAIKNKGKSKFQCFVDAARHDLELKMEHFRDDDFTKKCRKFLEQKGVTEASFPDNWVSEPKNSQYRASLLEPIKSNFVTWYENYPAMNNY